LFLWVGPGVGVVKIEEKEQAQAFRLLGQREGVGQIVRQLRRRMKKSESNPVVAVIAEDLQPRFLHAAVLELRATFLGLLEERQVGADGVGERGQRPGRRRSGRGDGFDAQPAARSSAGHSRTEDVFMGRN